MWNARLSQRDKAAVCRKQQNAFTFIRFLGIALGVTSSRDKDRTINVRTYITIRLYVFNV